MYWWRLFCSKVCGHDKTEVRENKISNAFHATKAAKEERSVPGKPYIYRISFSGSCCIDPSIHHISYFCEMHYSMPWRRWINCKPQILIRRLVFRLSGKLLRSIFPLSLFLFSIKLWTQNCEIWALDLKNEKGKKIKREKYCAYFSNNMENILTISIISFLLVGFFHTLVTLD